VTEFFAYEEIGVDAEELVAHGICSIPPDHTFIGGCLSASALKVACSTLEETGVKPVLLLASGAMLKGSWVEGMKTGLWSILPVGYPYRDLLVGEHYLELPSYSAAEPRFLPDPPSRILRIVRNDGVPADTILILGTKTPAKPDIAYALANGDAVKIIVKTETKCESSTRSS